MEEARDTAIGAWCAAGLFGFAWWALDPIAAAVLALTAAAHTILKPFNRGLAVFVCVAVLYALGHHVAAATYGVTVLTLVTVAALVRVRR